MAFDFEALSHLMLLEEAIFRHLCLELFCFACRNVVLVFQECGQRL